MSRKKQFHGLEWAMMESAYLVGAVVIGRNEGERLERCLHGILKQIDKIVYVDSGSVDNSVAFAESSGVEVVQLDTTIPFSAGRARNDGFRCLVKKHEQLQYVQFVDGDCKLCEGWLDIGVKFLEKNSSCAVVAGRRNEKFPEESVYNLLCDIEWNTPIGDAEACGGDFMIRKEAFLQVNGFNPTVVAGEEPDMCYRLRKKNWSIFRLDQPMTLHDAAITRFSQWWKRAVRSGHAYAQGYALHAQDGQRYCFKDSVKIWFWATIFPASVLILTLSVNSVFLLFITAYLVQFVKIALRMYKRLGNAKYSIIYSIFTIIGRWPQLIGQLLFVKRKLMRENISIIEYN
ncbi:MAG: glycosyltransferase [Bacteroidales bacterium]|nr:glycosyltransferase [Bacteroidales bacterium]